MFTAVNVLTKEIIGAAIEVIVTSGQVCWNQRT